MEMTGKELFWEAAKVEYLATGKWPPIFPGAFLVSNKPLSESEMAAGKAVAEKHGWVFEDHQVVGSN